MSDTGAMTETTDRDAPAHFEARVHHAPAACRSTLYKVFSHAFAYPSADGLASWQTERCRALASEALGGLPYAAPSLERKLNAVLSAWDDAGGALAGTYTELFDNCRGKPAVGTRESDYLRTDMKTLWEDLIRFYEHFGLAFSLERQRIWPDHLTTELDSLHYLSFIEAARDADNATLVRGQHDFLDRHLGRWTGAFAAALAAAENAAPYATLAALLAEFVAADLGYLQGR